MIDVRPLLGAEFEAALDDVARLRITVFREWPYLYDGDAAYERGYSQVYRDNAEAILVGAFDHGKLIGAATGLPLVHHADDFAAAFDRTGIDLSSVFYCAESVLLPDYRGLGIGHGFFDQREAHAGALGYARVAFCGMNRPVDHPLRPDDARSLQRFWRGRGYEPLENVVARFAWKDIDQPMETEKSLQFWIRAL